MAKKKTVGPETPAGKTTAATRRRAPSTTAKRKSAVRPDPGIAEPGVTPPAEPLDLGADLNAGAGSSDSAARDPTHDEIAEAAYQRYLERGGGHGLDFDDWLEAERRLRNKR